MVVMFIMVAMFMVVMVSMVVMVVSVVRTGRDGTGRDKLTFRLDLTGSFSNSGDVLFGPNYIFPQGSPMFFIYTVFHAVLFAELHFLQEISHVCPAKLPPCPTNTPRPAPRECGKKN